MFFKIVFISAIMACVYAQKHDPASYSSINYNQKYQEAPALVKTGYAAPAIIKAPVYQAAHAVGSDHPQQHHEEYPEHHHHHEEYPDTHPQYSFQYAVKDEETHDIHNQHEERDGDVVKGYYSLLQPDGVTRTVHYTADHKNGFNAQVEYSGHATHIQEDKKVVTKPFAAAPGYHAPVTAPVHHAYHH